MSKQIPSSVRITSILPNPDGSDRGRETVTVTNSASVSLQGWTLRDMAGHTFELSGAAVVGADTTIEFNSKGFTLNNKGDIIYLFDSTGAVAHRIDYDGKDVVSGKSISYPDPTEAGKPPVAAYISAILPDPDVDENESITIRGLIATAVDVSDWKFTDKAGHMSDLYGELQPGEQKTFVLKPDNVSLNNKGDELALVDSHGAVVHSVVYKSGHVYSGVYVDFDQTAPSPTMGSARLPTVTISSLLPQPIGKARQTVTLKVRGCEADLAGWRLRNAAGNEAPLSGKVKKKGQKTVVIPAGGLSADGGKVMLVNPAGQVVHAVEYESQDVARGAAIDFAITEDNVRGVAPRVPSVTIASVLPRPDGADPGRETVSIAAGGALVDVSGWTVSNKAGKSVTLEGMIGEGCERKFVVGELSLESEGDELSLKDEKGATVHKVAYSTAGVKSGVVIDFGVSEADPDTGAARTPTVEICSMLPNPDGVDAGRELVVLKARGAPADLTGWTLRDKAGRTFALGGGIGEGEDRSVLLAKTKFALNNRGDSVQLVDADGAVVSVGTYEADEVLSGVLVDFGTTKGNAVVGKARVPTVMIARLMPLPGADESLCETVTIKARGAAADLGGWRVRDQGGNEYKLSGVVDDEKTFRADGLQMGTGSKGDVVSLIDKYNREVHRVRYAGGDLVEGKELQF